MRETFLATSIVISFDQSRDWGVAGLEGATALLTSEGVFHGHHRITSREVAQDLLRKMFGDVTTRSSVG